MTHGFTRRAALAALASAFGTAALAEAPLTSLRPKMRPGRSAPLPAQLRPTARTELEALIDRIGPGGDVALALTDLAERREILGRHAETGMPPASVAKALTALYGLETLGPAQRFTTRLVATGTVANGVLDGDLALVGGGDPTLVTDDLAEMAAELAAAGIRSIAGRFLVYGGALPFEDEIDETQLDHLGYNPSVSGLNLNFNRVHFEWARSGADYRLSLDARSARHRPVVSMAEVRLADRSLPVYTYTSFGDVDSWTVARTALGDGGSRWLPVRRPALYCGDVFRTLARAQGVTLPEAARATEEPTGTEIARRDSVPMDEIVREMLKYSTNLTAEVVGLSATKALSGTPADIPSSAATMNAWLADRYGIEAALVDHSGLGDTSRISAGAMVRLLSAPGVLTTLKPVLKTHELKDPEGRPMTGYPASVAAKTGTLNFVSSLAGYVRTAEGRDLAFAIFCGDLDRRAAAKAAGDEVPDGVHYYNGRAKNLQQQLLQRWGLTYADRPEQDLPVTDTAADSPPPGGLSLDALMSVQ